MKRYLCILLLGMSVTLWAQNDKLTLSGSIQSDVLIPQNDSVIGAERDGDQLKTNTYIDLLLQSKHVDAGVRVEYMDHPLPGFDSDFKGWGVPHAYVKGRMKNAELTLGTFYEQFGSGFILRSYEERSLGIDNSLLGAHLQLTPAEGLRLKALYGKQRVYWSWADNYIGGVDAEADLNEWLPALRKSGTRLTLGASWVNKHEKAEDHKLTGLPYKLNLPEYVNAWDVRANLHHGNWNVLAEYAQISDNPSKDNDYIYRRGYVAMLSTSYSTRGLSLLLQAKRSDNTSLRSQRDRQGTAAMLNHLPAFSLDHTYALAALYPYATQQDGEWAYQGQVGYNFRKNTSLGGKYGTNLRLNYSLVKGLNKNPHTNPVTGTKEGSDSYGSAFWKWGDTYYQDLNIQMDKRLTHDFKLSLMYMNQHYNKSVVEGDGGMIRSDIYVAEGKYTINRKATLRGELQYLTTAEDEGDWMFGLLELSLLPHWMLTVSDQWNCGVSKIHYYQGFVTFNTGAHRIQAGYARIQAGNNCSGGVCRYVPAIKGFILSYNYNF